MSEKIELIDFINLPDYQNLPYIFGNKDEFKSLYLNLKKINFPINIIKKYIFLKLDRWDLETLDNNIIKLPPKIYKKFKKLFKY